MPYYAKRSYRPYKRRQPYRKYRGKNQSLASKAYKLAKKAYKMPELKHNALSGTATGTSYNGGYLAELSTLAQGNTNNTRIGNQVHPTSVRIRPDWSNTSGFGANNNVRVVIFRWISEAPNLGFNQATQVLQSATMNSFKSEELRFYSEILYDRTWFSDNRDVQVMPPEIRIKLNKPIGYSDSTSAAVRNGIYILILNDQAGTSFDYTYTSRLFFRDP